MDGCAPDLYLEQPRAANCLGSATSPFFYLFSHVFLNPVPSLVSIFLLVLTLSKTPRQRCGRGFRAVCLA